MSNTIPTPSQVAAVFVLRISAGPLHGPSRGEIRNIKAEEVASVAGFRDLQGYLEQQIAKLSPERPMGDPS